MVGDLLEMSRADAGSVDVFLEEVERRPSWCARSVVAGFGHMDGHGPRGATRRARSIRPCTRWRVGVDKRRFERVMVNLWRTPPTTGAGSPRSPSGPARRGQVEVTVDDAGPGIDPQERAQGVRALLPWVGVGPAGHGHGDGPGPGARGRAHARDARGRPRRVLPRRAARASSSRCRCCRRRGMAMATRRGGMA